MHRYVYIQDLGAVRAPSLLQMLAAIAPPSLVPNAAKSFAVSKPSKNTNQDW